MKFIAKNDFTCMYDVKVKKGEQLRKYKGFYRNDKGIAVCPVFSIEANENVIAVNN